MGMSILHKIWSLRTKQISCGQWKDLLGPDRCINFTCVSSLLSLFVTIPTHHYNHIGNLHSLILQQNRFLFCLILSYEQRMVFILTRSFISIEYSSIGENSWNDLVLGICITPSNISLKITLVLSTSALEINLKIIFWIFSLQNWDIPWWHCLIF